MPDQTPNFIRDPLRGRIFEFEELGSTNEEAKARASAGLLDEATEFVAANQVAGQGRRGRVWHGPAGGLWWTLACPVRAVVTPAMLGLRVGGAALESITSLLGREGVEASRIQLKWPNDILVDEKKICGCLVETTSAASQPGVLWLIVGIGINVNNDPEHLPADLRRAPTSMAAVVGRPVSVSDLRQLLLRAVLAAIALDEAQSSSEALRKITPRLHGIDQSIALRTPDGQSIRGVLRGLSDSGLLVLDCDGRRTVAPAGAEIE